MSVYKWNSKFNRYLYWYIKEIVVWNRYLCQYIKQIVDILVPRLHRTRSSSPQVIWLWNCEELFGERQLVHASPRECVGNYTQERLEMVQKLCLFLLFVFTSCVLWLWVKGKVCWFQIYGEIAHWQLFCNIYGQIARW